MNHALPSTRHTLRDRTDHLEAIERVCKSNYAQRRELDHKSHGFVVIPGGSGIGKTRLGYEASRIQQQRCVSKYLFINFRSGERFDKDFDGAGSTYPEGVQLGVRLLCVYLGVSFERVIHLEDIRSYLKALNVPEVLSFIADRTEKSLLMTLGSEVVVRLIIHIDEFQAYIRHVQDSIKELDGGYGARQFDTQLMSIGSWMSSGHSKRMFVVPIMSGLSDVDITMELSKYPVTSIHPTPLSEDSALELLREACPHDSAEWLKQEPFRVAFGDTGYVPWVLDRLFKFGKDSEAPERTIDWGTGLHIIAESRLPEQVVVRVDSVLLALLKLTICQIPVRKTRDLSGTGKITVGDVENMGVIFCKEFQESDGYTAGRFLISMPFCYIQRLNVRLISNGRQHAFPQSLLFSPAHGRSWHWQDFEKLQAHFQALLINLLGHAEKDPVAYRALPLFFRGALAGSKAKSCQVLPGKGDVGVFYEAEKFLSRVDGQVPFSTATVAEGKERDLTDGVFICAEGNALFDSRVAFQGVDKRLKLVMVQSKFSGLSTKKPEVLCSFVLEWYDKAKKSMALFSDKGVDVFYLFFTNRKLTGELDRLMEQCPSLLLISRDQLSGHLGPVLIQRALIPRQPDRRECQPEQEEVCPVDVDCLSESLSCIRRFHSFSTLGLFAQGGADDQKAEGEE